MARIAICLGFRNWHREHLQRCLQSLRAGAPDWPILVADTGSPEPDMPEIRRLCAEVSARLVCEVQPEWSRSRALNLAARQAPDADTYIFTDADMIFPASWFGALIDTLGYTASGRIGWRENQYHLWLTRARDLDELATKNLPTAVTESWLLANTTEHPSVGQGAAMVIPGPWFRDVGGFDEFYRIWGAEDQDLVNRAQWGGHPVKWLRQSTGALAFVVHQWHARDWPNQAQWEQVRRNRAYYADRLLERGPIVRNRP